MALVVAPDAIWDVVDGITVVVNLHTGERLELNPSAAAVWSALLRGDPPPAAAQALAEEFPGIPRSRLEQDVASFVTHLVEEGVLAEDGGS